MAVGGVYSSNGYNFDILLGIKQQDKETDIRKKDKVDSRNEEKEKTGSIKNKDGDTADISLLTENKANASSKGRDLVNANLQKGNTSFIESDPDADEAKAFKERSARMKGIYDKMVAGQKVTADEKSFMRKYYPEMAAKSDRMEQEAAQLLKRLRSSKSKEDAERIYLDAKMSVASEVANEDSSALFMSAAIDSAYAEYNGKSSSKKGLDISA